MAKGHNYEAEDNGPKGHDLNKSPTARQDNYGMKYSGGHGTQATGGPWKESPGQGGTAIKASKTSIKGINKVAP